MPALSFSKVGVNPSDTAFASVAYSSNPSWNPLQDIQVILNQIHTRITDLAGISLDTETCIKWYYIPTATVSSLLSAYNSAISGSSLSNKEDWLIYVNAMKDFLEGLSGLDIESVPWTSTTGSLNADSGVRVGTVTADIAGINKTGANTGAAITGDCPPFGDPSNGYWAVDYGVDQNYGAITWNVTAGVAAQTGSLDLSVGIQNHPDNLADPVIGEAFLVSYPTCSTITEDELFQIYAYTGWFQVTRSKRRFTVSVSTTGGMPSSILNGKTFNWEAKLKEYNGSGPSSIDSDIPHSFIGASTGTFTIGALPSYIDVEVELSGAIIADTAEPFVGGYYEDDSVWIAKAGILVIEITPDNYPYCKTGCNTYIEDV
jgi:hypothetical protein